MGDLGKKSQRGGDSKKRGGRRGWAREPNKMVGSALNDQREEGNARPLVKVCEPKKIGSWGGKKKR